MSLSVDQYEDFVLKLKIKAVDGSSQIRRVRLPRIADTAGNVCYEELVGLVVTFTFPDESSPENFNCTLTYFDEDEDTVTIASTTELADAIEQFVDKKVLRISTEVKRKSPSSAAQPSSAAPTAQAGAQTTERGTSTKLENLEPNLQNVLESFAGILITAVNSLEKGLANSGIDVDAKAEHQTAPVAPANDSEAVSSEETSAAAPVARTPSPPPTPTPCAAIASKKPEVVKETLIPYVHRRHTCDSCLMNPIVGPRYHAANILDYDLCENCFPNYSGKETEFISYPTEERIVRSTGRTEQTQPTTPIEPTEQVNTDAPESPRSPESAARIPKTIETTEIDIPFIHGRHTCDSCLMNPIVGKRFHAKNMKDYDLCETCHANYQGTEIQFEAMELARDRAFQKRWNRRRQRIEKMNRKRPGRRFGRGRRCSGSAPEPTPTPPPPETVTPPPSSAPVEEQESAARSVPSQPSAPTEAAATVTEDDDFDGAIKEAIRRSLQDVMPKEVVDLFESNEPIVAPSAPPEEEVHESVSDAADVIEAAEPAVTSNTDEVEVVDNLVIAGEETLANSTMVEVDEQRLLDSMVEDTLSVNSEEMVNAAAIVDVKPAALDREMSVSTPDRSAVRSGQPSSPGTTSDDSFALDAVGNGDVAEAMGATLDIVAGVIAEMLTEADAHNTPSAVHDDVLDESTKTECENTSEGEAPEGVQDQAKDVTEDSEAAVTSTGALIVGSDESTEDSKEEVDGWQVVDESPNEASDFANATQMLGSALFNSEMRSSGPMDLVNSGTISDASTVPSDLPSISVATEVSTVSAAQRSRWASQLYMLREMGFDDEQTCVETLERLQAANIGCGEEDEVSVSKVVDVMLSEQQ